MLCASWPMPPYEYITQAGAPSAWLPFIWLRITLLGMRSFSFLRTLVFILQCPTHLFYSLPSFLFHAELSLVDRIRAKPSSPHIIFLALAIIKSMKANQHEPCLGFGRITMAPLLPLCLTCTFSTLQPFTMLSSTSPSFCQVLPSANLGTL